MDIDKSIYSVIGNGDIECSLSGLKLILRSCNIVLESKIITITGTNGKGSAVSLIVEMLKNHNKSYVAHTSPHLQKFNERVNVNGSHISDLKVIEYINIIKKNHNNIKLNYHHISFLCACMAAKEFNPEYLVLEVGIGGRLDPANIFDADYGIITNIGLDHTALLGETLYEIGLEKAHIARANKPIFLAKQMPESVYDYCNKINAEAINCGDYSIDIKNGNPLAKDSYNAVCELQKYMIERKLLSSAKHHKSLSDTKVRSRCHIIQDIPLIIVDVAHNYDSVKYLFDWISGFKEIENRCVHAFFSHIEGKDTLSILKGSKSIVDVWHIFSLDKIDARGISLTKLKEALKKENKQFVEYLNITDAFKQACNLNGKNDIAVVFGSFVVAGKFLDHYEKRNEIY